MSNPFGNPAGSGLSAALATDNIADETIHFGSDLGGQFSIDLSASGINSDIAALIIKLLAAATESPIKIENADNQLLFEVPAYPIANNLDIDEFSVVGRYDPANPPAFGVAVSRDGKHWYSNSTTDTVYQYDMAIPWDITSSSYSGNSYDLSTEDAQPQDITFSADGMKMYMTGQQFDKVFAYDLGSAWSLASVTHNSEEYDPAEDTNLGSCQFSPDGLKAFIVGTNTDDIFQYTLSVAWDISSASYASKSISFGAAISLTGARFTPDGLNVLALVRKPYAVLEVWRCPTRWDLASAVKTSLDIPIESITLESDLRMFDIGPDGKYLYIGGGSTQDIVQIEIAKMAAHSQHNIANLIGRQNAAWVPLAYLGSNATAAGSHKFNNSGEPVQYESSSANLHVFDLLGYPFTLPNGKTLRVSKTRIGAWGDANNYITNHSFRQITGAGNNNADTISLTDIGDGGTFEEEEVDVTDYNTFHGDDTYRLFIHAQTTTNASSLTKLVAMMEIYYGDGAMG